MSNPPEVFWMVQGAGPAHIRHKHRADARREADRLARENPGKQFFVMQAVDVYRKMDVEHVDLVGDEIPF